MSTDKIDPNKNSTEVLPKDGKTELTEEELGKVSGGGTVTLNFGKIETTSTSTGGTSTTQPTHWWGGS